MAPAEHPQVEAPAAAGVPQQAALSDGSQQVACAAVEQQLVVSVMSTLTSDAHKGCTCILFGPATSSRA